MAEPKITVVGSINMDLVIGTDRIPRQGETIIGSGYSTFPGGKGANQAVAAARLGGYMTMIGAVGNDSFGKELLRNLTLNRINTDAVTVYEHEKSGMAFIMLSKRDNRIIVSPGTNHLVDKHLIKKHHEIISASDVLLLQLEIPLEAVMEAATIAKQSGVKVILNPAPYRSLPIELLNQVDYLTPNDQEAERLLSEIDDPSKIEDKLVVTKGKQGVNMFDHKKCITIPGYDVEVEDTTGAGDTFNGAFAYWIAKGDSLEMACHKANAAAALSVTKKGAQSGMPTMQQLDNFLANN
ncbi:ribokinase [Aquibacillus salsiterrae]|uniref:Ribokinase n=1 Tax=Aquibacillus salsiterrae TaxID=2950439 RepID=A0A9X3WC88_9BACI|nr:ribokinase [Aquibacillus salsiterrae]MDC3415923.1 ribokinase [Aquibacillus salsiterrae]